MVPTKIGLEILAGTPRIASSWGQCGLLVNQASVNIELVPSQVVLRQLLKGRLKVLFTPQHGLSAEKQDNMKESNDGTDFVSGLPFFSLYSNVREPTDSMLEGLDTVIIDIQDVGTRVYTFLATMAGIMRRCAMRGMRVVVLDRPNPIGGVRIEGNVLEDDSRSFVGEYPMPMRYGMTIAEAARWINIVGGVGVHLEVVRMKGWKRTMHWVDTGRPWVMTSPNIPTADTAEVYPGMVLLEGTNLSEGRGTTLPFLTVGAPFLSDGRQWIDILNRIVDWSGVLVRPIVFEPTFQKWAGQPCHGIQLVVKNPGGVRAYQMGLGVLLASMRVAPEIFRYNDPPYEYEHIRLPMQLLLGSSTMPAQLLKLAQSEFKRSVLRDLAEEWEPRLRTFKRQRSEILLYS